MCIRDRLTGVPNLRAARTLLKHWPSFLPDRRQHVSEALVNRVDWSLELLDAIKSGEVRTQELSLAHQQKLLRSRDKSVADRAATVIGTRHNREALQVVSHYTEEVMLGNASQGRSVFDSNCKVCHTLDRNEMPVGPDLRSLTNRSRAALLTSILDPSQTIEPKYFNYSIVLKNGEVLGGVVTEETENSLTIVDSNGKGREVERRSIEFAKRSDKSMMPEGFESKITPRQMSDLLAYLRDL